MTFTKYLLTHPVSSDGSFCNFLVFSMYWQSQVIKLNVGLKKNQDEELALDVNTEDRRNIYL